MRTIVTGGAGFIGSHLADALIDAGHEVVVIDNLSTGRRDTIAHLVDHPRLIFHEDDINNFADIRPLFEGVDWVFHLAALADIVPSIQHPTAYHRANVDGTLSVLEASRAGGAKRFVYAASSSCYGIPDHYPTPETAALRPQYPYAFTKMVGEQFVMHWNQVYGLPAVSLRQFNVYGPRSRTAGTYGAVFGVFLAQKLAGEPYTVVGDGEQTRDFTYVTDIARAFMMAAESDLSGAIMNLGSRQSQSVNRLVELLGGPKIHIPKRPGEPDCTFADVSRVERLLGWRAEVGFEEGVARMLEQIDSWREAPVWTPERIEDATRDWFRYLGKGE